MLITNNPDYAAEAKLLRSHGMTTMSYQRASGHATEYDVVRLGYNYRMDDIHAAIGLAQLDKLPADLEQRAEVRAWYLEALKDNQKIIVPFTEHSGFVSNYVFPVVIRDANRDQRDALRNHIHERGVQTSVHYPAVHRFSSFKNFYVDLPKTDNYVMSTLTLPMYAKLTEHDINEIAQTVRKT